MRLDELGRSRRRRVRQMIRSTSQRPGRVPMRSESFDEDDDDLFDGPSTRVDRIRATTGRDATTASSLAMPPPTDDGNLLDILSLPRSSRRKSNNSKASSTSSSPIASDVDDDNLLDLLAVPRSGSRVNVGSAGSSPVERVSTRECSTSGDDDNLLGLLAVPRAARKGKKTRASDGASHSGDADDSFMGVARRKLRGLFDAPGMHRRRHHANAAAPSAGMVGDADERLLGLLSVPRAHKKRAQAQGDGGGVGAAPAAPGETMGNADASSSSSSDKSFVRLPSPESVYSALISRHRVLGFRADSVPEEAIERALNAALAGSDAGGKTVRFHWLGPKAVRQVRARFPHESPWSAPGAIIVTCLRGGDAEEQRELYAAGSCAAQALALALWSDGVGVEPALPAVAKSPLISELTGVDWEGELCVAMLWFGYPAAITLDHEALGDPAAADFTAQSHIQRLP